MIFHSYVSLPEGRTFMKIPDSESTSGMAQSISIARRTTPLEYPTKHQSTHRCRMSFLRSETIHFEGPRIGANHFEKGNAPQYVGSIAAFFCLCLDLMLDLWLPWQWTWLTWSFIAMYSFCYCHVLTIHMELHTMNMIHMEISEGTMATMWPRDPLRCRSIESTDLEVNIT